MMLKLDFRYNWSLWPMPQNDISWVSWVLPSPTMPLDVPGGRVMTSHVLFGIYWHVWDFQKHMDERFPINNSKVIGTLIDYPPNSIIQIILADSLYRDLDPINKPSFLTSYPKILSLLRESPLIKVNRSWCDVSFWWNIPSYHMLPASPVAYLPIPDILGETEPPRDSRDQRSSRWPDNGRGMAYGSWGANTKKKTGGYKTWFLNRPT